MEIIWDPDKAALNMIKHGVRFSDAEAALWDALALTLEEQVHAGEKRHVTLGMSMTGFLVVVVYVYRGECIRIISARKATKRERKSYGKGI
ncbi:BrnT family toxin [Desulfoluna butyratoxydans]|uniref:BrnT family toxin n=1 Tax=Desulfoluna butyratoxydans TaxID=231438 RepID=UPI0015D21F1C|nr:BrnT family toxin [Desulfoluna butyratoxydans]